MKQPLHKVLGPIGRPRYRWITTFDQPYELYTEVLESAKELGFRIINVYDYDHQEFTIESKTDAMEAQFILTWSEIIDANQYDHDVKRKFKADWITKVLYHTVRQTERSLPLSLLVTVSVIIGPTIAAKIWNIPYLGIISALGMTALMSLVLLRAYDDIRLNRHERKQRQKDEEEWERKFRGGGLHEIF